MHHCERRMMVVVVFFQRNSLQSSDDPDQSRSVKWEATEEGLNCPRINPLTIQLTESQLLLHCQVETKTCWLKVISYKLLLFSSTSTTPQCNLDPPFKLSSRWSK